MSSIAAVLLGCRDSLKSILASQEFGSEYELLCTELSIQSLRVRLWGESVGLDMEESARPLDRVFKRPDVENTITQTIHSIAYVLSEIEILRRKYDLQPSSPDPREDFDSSKHSRSWKSFGSLFVTSPTKTVLQERMLKNQKQKSFLAIAKWASVDARKFEEKIRVLKSLIDGLESISKAAGVISPPPKTSLDPPTVPDDSPPPYTTVLRPRATRSATEPSRTMTLRQTSLSVAPSAAVRRKHLTAMKSYLAEHPGNPNPVRKSREKLVLLSEAQVEELLIDVHDELIRRQTLQGSPDHLPETPGFHPNRNLARKKFGSFPELRFQDLVSDLVAEVEKRYPVQVEKSPTTSAQTLAPVHDSRSRSRSRSQTVPSSPQPFIETPTTTTINLKRAQSHSAQKPSSSDLKRHPSTPTTPGTRTTVTKFKSFRVNLDDPTSKVLPSALKKHNIDGPCEHYALFICCASEDGSADVERQLGLDEKPLEIFKKLNEVGRKPLFMLRKYEKKDS